jgi:hypothetical protein
VRTRLTDAIDPVLFPVDALPAFSDADFAASMDDLCALLRSGWPDARVESSVCR